MAKKAGLVSCCSFDEISFVSDSHWIQQVFMATHSNVNADPLLQKSPYYIKLQSSLAHYPYTSSTQ
ncbi:MAG: hypothetical protein RM022_023435 [Nostoc sp. EfeVER01]|uniref:hypothetical protein n=1 Tax=Nostoc sp. EfeVER01 TaxID=3075406 RepID=UPI002AD2448D|nr:hypothetical protein [Nostoc sp. EfeVER01]MDZ7948170.1 hypothetical protein [Nostoc sp. EfeVER01]